MQATEFETHLGKLELSLERLKSLYEQWFQGIERIEPTIPRKEVDRAINMMRRNMPRNTALRFRLHQVIQRYNTYTIYWKRVARQIEEGTYRRDVMRARKRREQKEATNTMLLNPATIELDVDLDTDVSEILKELEEVPSRQVEDPSASVSKPQDMKITRIEVPKRPPPVPIDARKVESSSEAVLKASGLPAVKPKHSDPAPPIPRASEALRKMKTQTVMLSPHAANTEMKQAEQDAKQRVASDRQTVNQRPPLSDTLVDAGIDDRKLRDLYRKYSEARAENNESAVRFESLVRKVRDAVPRLQKKHNTKNIDFEVVLSNGRVGLQPVKKK